MGADSSPTRAPPARRSPFPFDSGGSAKRPDWRRGVRRSSPNSSGSRVIFLPAPAAGAKVADLVSPPPPLQAGGVAVSDDQVRQFEPVHRLRER